MDELRHRTLAASASAYVLPALGGSLGPKRTGSAQPPGGRATARRRPAPQVDSCALLGPGPPEAEVEARAPSQASKVCRKGLPGSEPRSSWPWSLGHRQAPGCSRGCFRAWMGGWVRSRAPPGPQRLQPQLPASCVSPSGPEVTGKQLDRQLGTGRPPLSAGAPRQRQGGRRGVRLCFLPTLSAKLSLKPGSPGPRPGCTARRAQRPAPRSQPREEARRGGRPGHCAAGAASLGCRCPDSGRAEPREPAAPCGAVGLRAPDWRRDPAPGAPRSPLAESLGGGPFICNTEESALQPGPAPTHPPAPGNQPGRSPES